MENMLSCFECNKIHVYVRMISYKRMVVILAFLPLSRARHSSFSPSSVDFEQRHNHLAFHLGCTRYRFVHSHCRPPTSNMSTSLFGSCFQSLTANPIAFLGAKSNATLFYEPRFSPALDD
jgi:hypothetical protein